MLKRSRALAASFMISRSLSLPMMMETTGFRSISYFLIRSAISDIAAKLQRPHSRRRRCGSLLALQAAMGDVAAKLHPVKADAMDGLVSAGDRRLQSGGARSDSQDASARGDDFAAVEAGAGVEDLDAIEGVGV